MLRKIVIPLFYALIGFLALYAVIFSSGERIPGQGVTDYYHFNWSYWWIKHALTTPNTYLYETNYVIFPATSNLAYHTMAVFWFPIWAVAEPIVGSLAAFNVISWVAFTLAGTCCYAFLRQEGVSRGLALLGGVVLEVTPLMFMSVWWTTPNLSGVFWYPTHLLLWGTVARTIEHRWKSIMWAVLEGVALWAAAMTDLQYLLFLSVLLVPYGLLTLFESKNRLKLIVLGCLALMVFGLLMWFAGPLKPMLEFDRGKAVAAESGLVWGIPFPEGYIGIPDYAHFNAVGGFITFSALTATIFTIVQFFLNRQRITENRKPLFWFGVMLIPLVISAGLDITIANTTIKMPYSWIHEPLGGTFRAPGRFGAVFVVPALAFVGQTLTPLFTKKPRLILIPCLLLGLLAHHHVLKSVPTQPAPPEYAFYKMMGDETYEYVVVEVPVAVGDAVATVGKPEDLAPMYYGSIHHKHMITGHFSRAYLEYYWYLRTDHPVLSWLGQRRDLDPNVVEPMLREMIDTYPIGYFVIHQEAIGLETVTNQEIIGYFNQLDDLLCPVVVEKEVVVYRTAWHPDGCPPRTPPHIEENVYFVDIGGIEDEKYLGWGWYWPEYPAGISWRWAGEQPQSTLYVDLPSGAYEITLAAQSFWQARNLQLKVNGLMLEGIASISTDSLTEITFNVSADAIGDGKHIEVQLIYSTPTVPVEVGQSADERRLAIAVDWMKFRKLPR